MDPQVLPVKVMLVLFRSRDSDECTTRVVEVPIHGDSPVSSLQCSIEKLVSEERATLLALKYRGARLHASERVASFAPHSISKPRFTALYLDCTFDQTLFVRTAQGRVVAVQTRSDLTIACLKELLYQKTGIPPQHQRLTFQAAAMSDAKTLANLGVLECDVLHLDCSLSGGGNPGASFTFADVSLDDDDAVIALETTRCEFNSSHRASRVGVNLEAFCANRSCIAGGERVVCALGMGAWPVPGEGLACPLCHQYVSPHTCGLSHCRWMFEGSKVSPELAVTRCQGRWKIVHRGEYYRFLWARGFSAQWQSLVITASPLPALDCGICCCRLPRGRDCDPDVCSARCGHRFHTACLRAWSYQQRRGDVPCPLCDEWFTAGEDAEDAEIVEISLADIELPDLRFLVMS